MVLMGATNVEHTIKNRTFKVIKITLIRLSNVNNQEHYYLFWTIYEEHAKQISGQQRRELS